MGWKEPNDYKSIIERHENRIKESTKIINDLQFLFNVEPKNIEQELCKNYIITGNKKRTLELMKNKINADEITETIKKADKENNVFGEYANKILDANSPYAKSKKNII